MTPGDRHADTSWFGAVLGIGAAAMLMISLFFAEAYLRASAELWPPAGVPRVPRVLPTVNLVVLAAASGVLHFGSRRKGGAASVEESRSGDRSYRSSDAVALLLGGLFLALDLLLWRTLLANGFTPARTGAYGALFFALSFAHAALVLPGLLGLVSLLRRPRASARRGWLLYWDFLTVAFALFLLGGIWL